jgi:hypothetical protein
VLLRDLVNLGLLNTTHFEGTLLGNELGSMAPVVSRMSVCRLPFGPRLEINLMVSRICANYEDREGI